jgi:hypothetical protein
MMFGEKKSFQNRVLDRAKMVVPVRILTHDRTGKQVTLLAHTLDASSSGTRLGGFHGQVELGQTVVVQYQYRRCNFRVIWIGKRGTAQGTQVGLECLEPQKNIWNIEFEQGVPKSRVTSIGDEFSLAAGAP